jgi:hypothetical protein
VLCRVSIKVAQGCTLNYVHSVARLMIKYCNCLTCSGLVRCSGFGLSCLQYFAGAESGLDRSGKLFETV